MFCPNRWLNRWLKPIDAAQLRKGEVFSPRPFLLRVMFIDEIKVHAQAGHGGKGCVSFLREAFRPKGGPNGGNGGRGGDVILEADHDINNLIAQFYHPRLIAEHGGNGLGKGMDGRAAEDLIVKVPCGTLVWRIPSSGPSPEPPETDDVDDDGDDADLNQFKGRPRFLSSSRRVRLPYAGAEGPAPSESSAQAPPQPAGSGRVQGEFVADLTEHGQRFLLCRGGRGGLGNRNFATATRQAPRFAQPGEPGEEGHFILELRVLADVGLVGYPNAGKSTLLGAISRAHPKVAPYPFTTLHPQVGIVEYPDFFRVTVTDVPGLIEGAHRNVGLGFAFLRHIQRCKALAIVLDMAGTDGRLPWEDHDAILEELRLFDPTLIERPRLIVANKMDEPVAAANLKKFKRRAPKASLLPVAAAFDQGLNRFRTAIRACIEAPPA
jgi:GTPase